MYYKNGNFKLFYEKYGSGKQVILILPGWGDTRPTFNYLIQQLSKDNTVYIIDNPGFGNSEIIQNNLTIYDYASLIREFMLHEKINNPIIIAHSFGGRITTLLTGYYKDKIKKLILIDIASIRQKRNIKKIIKTYTYKLLKRLTYILPKNYRKKAQNRLLKLFSSADYFKLKDNVKKTFQNIVNEDLFSYLKSINTETLILWGEKDKDTPLKDAYKIKKEIKNSELIIFKNASHFSYLEYPTITLNIINEFIKY